MKTWGNSWEHRQVHGDNDKQNCDEKISSVSTSGRHDEADPRREDEQGGRHEGLDEKDVS